MAIAHSPFAAAMDILTGSSEHGDTFVRQRFLVRPSKAIVGRWFTEFCGNPWNPKIVDELGASDILFQYLLQAPRRGRADVKTFMAGFRSNAASKIGRPSITDA
jgi:hypothetical protein